MLTCAGLRVPGLAFAGLEIGFAAFGRSSDGRIFKLRHRMLGLSHVR